MPTEESNKVTQEVTNKGTMTNSANTIIANRLYVSVEGKSQAHHLEIEKQSKDQTKEDIDKQMVQELFTHFSTNVMDEFLNSEPEYITIEISAIADTWYRIINASGFCIYDKEVLKVIMDFYEPFRTLIMSSAKYYFVSRNPTLVHFDGLEWDVFKNNEAQKVFQEIKEQMLEILPKYKLMISVVKEKYVLNLNELSKVFEQEQNERKLRMTSGSI